MNTKHTPGPWETSRDAVPTHHVQVTVYAEADGQRVATVFREEANARLIAAAPDLLAALEELTLWARENTGPRVIFWSNAVAAIAKAKGEL